VCRCLLAVVLKHMAAATLVSVSSGQELAIRRKERLLLGRGLECPPPGRVNHPSVSTQHCWLTLTAGLSVEIVDTSTNGTFVNNKRLNRGQRVLLHNADVVRLAASVPEAAFRLQMGSAGAQSPRQKSVTSQHRQNINPWGMVRDVVLEDGKHTTCDVAEDKSDQQSVTTDYTEEEVLQRPQLQELQEQELELQLLRSDLDSFREENLKLLTQLQQEVSSKAMLGRQVKTLQAQLDAVRVTGCSLSGELEACQLQLSVQIADNDSLASRLAEAQEAWSAEKTKLQAKLEDCWARQQDSVRLFLTEEASRSELLAALKSSHEEVEKLKAQRQELQMKTKCYVDSFEEEQEKARSAQEQLERMQQKLELQMGQCEEAERRLTEVEVALVQVQSDKDRLLAHTQYTDGEHTQVLQTIHVELEALQAELRIHKTRTTEAEQKLAKVQREHEMGRKAEQRLVQEKRELTLQLEQEKSSSAELSGVVESLKRDLQTAERGLAGQQAKAEGGAQQLLQCSAEWMLEQQGLLLQLQQKDAFLAAHSAELQLLQDSFEAMQSEVETLQGLLRAQMAQTDEAESKAAQAQATSIEQINSAREEVEVIQSQMATLQQQLMVKISEHDAVHSKLSCIQKEQLLDQQVLEELRAENEGKELQLQILETKLNANGLPHAELAVCRCYQNQYDTLGTRLEEQNAILQTELDQVKQTLAVEGESWKARHGQLLRQVNEAENGKQRLIAVMKALSTNLEATQENNSILKAELEETLLELARVEQERLAFEAKAAEMQDMQQQLANIQASAQDVLMSSQRETQVLHAHLEEARREVARMKLLTQKQSSDIIDYSEIQDLRMQPAGAEQQQTLAEKPPSEIPPELALQKHLYVTHSLLGTELDASRPKIEQFATHSEAYLSDPNEQQWLQSEAAETPATELPLEVRMALVLVEQEELIWRLEVTDEQSAAVLALCERLPSTVGWLSGVWSAMQVQRSRFEELKHVVEQGEEALACLGQEPEALRDPQSDADQSAPQCKVTWSEREQRAVIASEQRAMWTLLSSMQASICAAAMQQQQGAKQRALSGDAKWRQCSGDPTVDVQSAGLLSTQQENVRLLFELEEATRQVTEGQQSFDRQLLGFELNNLMAEDLRRQMSWESAAERCKLMLQLEEANMQLAHADERIAVSTREVAAAQALVASELEEAQRQMCIWQERKNQELQAKLEIEMKRCGALVPMSAEGCKVELEVHATQTEATALKPFSQQSVDLKPCTPRRIAVNALEEWRDTVERPLVSDVRLLNSDSDLLTALASTCQQSEMLKEKTKGTPGKSLWPFCMEREANTGPPSKHNAMCFKSCSPAPWLLSALSAGLLRSSFPQPPPHQRPGPPEQQE